METTIVPLALQDRLGPDGTLGLLEFMQAINVAWRNDMVEVVTDRFERRLSVEVASLREEMAAGCLATANEFASVRQEMANGLAAVRQEMANGFIAVRKEMADGRVDFIKWSFLFWVGQVAVLSGVMALLLRSFSLR